MTSDGAAAVSVDLTELSSETRSLVESIMASSGAEIVRSGEPVGSLAFRPAVVEGVLIPPAQRSGPQPPGRHRDVTVVATTMRLSEAARSRLSTAFGDAYVVLDFADAPATADVVLTHPVSHQLIRRWTAMFPQARIVVTEILDGELGLDVRGPVGILLDAGADAYLPPRPVEQVARTVRGFLASQGHQELEDRPSTTLEFGPADGVPHADGVHRHPG